MLTELLRNPTEHAFIRAVHITGMCVNESVVKYGNIMSMELY